MNTLNTVDLLLPGAFARLSRSEPRELISLSDRDYVRHFYETRAKWDSTNRALRLHMLGSVFCGQYPLEMRQSRRMKDSFVCRHSRQCLHLSAPVER